MMRAEEREAETEAPDLAPTVEEAEAAAWIGKQGESQQRGQKPARRGRKKKSERTALIDPEAAGRTEDWGAVELVLAAVELATTAVVETTAAVSPWKKEDKVRQEDWQRSQTKEEERTAFPASMRA